MKRSRSYYIIPRTREVNVEMYQAVRAWAAVPSGRSVRTSPGAWCRPDSCRQPGCGQQRSRRCRVSRRGRLGGRRPIRVRPPAPTKRPVLAPGRARCLCMRVGGPVGGWVGGCWWVSEVCVGCVWGVCLCVCVWVRARTQRGCQCSLALQAPWLRALSVLACASSAIYAAAPLTHSPAHHRSSTRLYLYISTDRTAAKHDLERSWSSAPPPPSGATASMRVRVRPLTHAPEQSAGYRCVPPPSASRARPRPPAADKA
jgi:hypothetical protein